MFIKVKVEILGNVNLEGIPKARAGKESISIAFSYDLNGLLVVEGSILSTGKSVIAEIKTTEGNANIIDDDSWKDAPKVKKYRTVVNKGDKLVNQLRKNGNYGLALQIEDVLLALKNGLILDLDADLLDEKKDHLIDLYSEV